MSKEVVKNGFDLLSGVYDILASLIFGDAIPKSQTTFLQTIPDDAWVLIVGGGTGKILIEILDKHPDVNIDYVELSEGMMGKAKKRLIGLVSNVSFIQGTIEDLPEGMQYDVIVTPFFLDMFSTQTSESIIISLNRHLVNEGAWLYTDFRNTEVWWQRWLLKTMYRFFRVCCNIEAKQLPEVKSCFEQQGLLNLNSKYFYHGMIEAVCYKKKQG